MQHNQLTDRASRRTLEKLTKMLSQNEMQLHLVLQLVNSQWASYQDTMKKNNKNKMHNPSLEGLYQTLTKQQEIIYKQRENIILLKNRIGLRDDLRKQKLQHTNVQIESLSDSLISMSLADQVQNERSKFTDKKLKNLKNHLTSRNVVVIKPQRPERLGLNSEIILEKRNQIIRNLNTTSKVIPVTQQSATARLPQIPVATQHQTKLSIGASVPHTTQQSNLFGSSVQAPPLQSIPFGAQKKEDASKFSITTGNQPAFGGFNASMVQKPMTVSGFVSNQPFQPATAPLAFDVGKRKEAPPANSSSVMSQSVSIVPQQEPLKLSAAKPSTTISNANVAVSATFSIPLSSKVSSTASSKDPKVNEKKIEEANPGGPVVTLKAPMATTPIAFGFSSSGNTSFSFGGTSSSKAPDSKTTGAPAIVTSSIGFSGFGETTSFTGFGSKPASETFGAQPSGTSVFGSGATPAFGGFGVGSSTGFALNTTGNDNTPKATASTTSSDSFSFVSSLTTTTSEVKSNPQQPIKQPVKSTAVTSTFTLGQTTISAVPATTSEIQTPPTSTFSFANFSTASSIPTTTTSALAAALKPDVDKPTTTNTTTDTTLQGLNICSPEVIPKSLSQAPSATSIFGSATTFNTVNNADSSSSIFGSSSTVTKVDNALCFGSALNLTPSATPQTSIFGALTTATTPSATSPTLFGALNLTSNADVSKVTATSPPSGLFSSLVKPDQSVFGGALAVPAIASPFGGSVSTAGSPFGGSATTAATSAATSPFGGSATTAGSPFGGSATTSAPAAGSPFGGIFANANNGGSSSVFGGAATNNGGSIFGGASATQTSVFGGASAFGSTATTSSSVFGSSTGGVGVFSNSNTTAQTGGSIFGGFGNTPQGNAGSVFGSDGTSSTATPFGGSSVFGGSSAAPQQSAFGGSVFGGGNSNHR